MEQALEETLGGHRTQDTENQLFWILSVSVSEFDIMVLGMITLAATTVAGLILLDNFVSLKDSQAQYFIR